MLQHLSRTAREVREAAGATQIQIAVAAGVSEPTISNFERGVNYPERLDPVIETYEDRCGLARGDLWRAAAAKVG